MADGTSPDIGIRSVRDLQATEFGKVDQAQGQRGIQAESEFSKGKGGKVFTFDGGGHAWMVQEFSFDPQGVLNGVRVEKRLLKDATNDNSQAARMFVEASTSNVVNAPVYEIALSKDTDGRFSVVRQKTSDAGRGELWEKEFKANRRDIKYPQPTSPTASKK